MFLHASMRAAGLRLLHRYLPNRATAGWRIASWRTASWRSNWYGEYALSKFLWCLKLIRCPRTSARQRNPIPVRSTTGIILLEQYIFL